MASNSPCRCPQCSPEPLPTWTPAWRLECEARWLLAQPLAARRDYLAMPLVQGRSAALKAEMTRLHKRARP